MQYMGCQSYQPPKKLHGIHSLEYHRGMKLLNNQGDKRDWELESACHWVRKAEERNLIDQIDAEFNLRRVLEKTYP